MLEGRGGGGGGATDLLNKGGGSNRLPGLVTKQAVEFPQVLASAVNTLAHDTVCQAHTSTSEIYHLIQAPD